ncbi:hypothetical protein QQ045_017974 [Rhodiola kirilowii]
MNDIRLKAFDRQMDFAMWNMRMKGILIKEKCWRAISEEWLCPTSDQAEKDLKEVALAEIMMRLTDDVARPLMKITDPKVLWDTSLRPPIKLSLYPIRYSFLRNFSPLRWNCPLAFKKT